MQINQYQKLAMRTANPKCKDMVNFALGLTGETGEVADIIKKHLFQGHELDKNAVISELGDVAWYLALGCEVIGVSMNDVLMANILKLEKRYPTGFNYADSINREDTEP